MCDEYKIINGPDCTGSTVGGFDSRCMEDNIGYKEKRGQYESGNIQLFVRGDIFHLNKI